MFYSLIMKELILIIKLGGSFKNSLVLNKKLSLFDNLSERHFNFLNDFPTFTSPLINIVRV